MQESYQKDLEEETDKQNRYWKERDMAWKKRQELLRQERRFLQESGLVHTHPNTSFMTVTDFFRITEVQMGKVTPNVLTEFRNIKKPLKQSFWIKTVSYFIRPWNFEIE